METGPYLHADEVEDSAEAARHVVPVILDAVGTVRSVADLGGGTGAWLHEFKRHGADSVFLFDLETAGTELLVERSEFQPVDLEQAFPPPPRVDLAVCVEVAEHLTAGRAGPLVDWLTAAADRVVFSGAVPGQDGNGHINERVPAYWSGLFAERGFVRRDVLRRALIHNEAVPFWYRQNLFVYVREGASIASNESDFLPEDFLLFHSWNGLLRPAPFGLVSWARLFVPAVQAVFRNRLQRRRPGPP
jgi:hypothetical protein